VAEGSTGTNVSVVSPGPPCPWGSVWCFLAGWNVLEVITKPGLWAVFDRIDVHKARMAWHTAFSWSVWLCCSETWHSQKTQASLGRDCNTSTLLPVFRFGLEWTGATSSGLSYCSARSFCLLHTKKKQKGNCLLAVKTDNSRLDLALWNTISR